MNTRQRMLRLWLMTLLIVLVIEPAVVGATPTKWQTFGNGEAVGRGWLASPSVSVDSTTDLRPVKVRFVVSGDAPDVSLSWSLDCFNIVGLSTRFASGSQSDVTLPFKKTVGKTWAGSYDYCALDVWAFSIDEGRLKLELQANYGA